MDYRIGLDIGITSVGWSVLENDLNGDPYKIVDLGVRLFDSPENPKDGSSPSVERRNARGRRRVIRRKRQRLNDLKKFLQKELLDNKEILFNGDDVYSLRNLALSCIISNNDICRVLYSIAKHRGFKSNRKSDDVSNLDNKKMLGLIASNSATIKSFQTVGEMYCKDARYFEEKEKLVNGEIKKYIVRNIRNKCGNYDKTIARGDLLNEIKIFLKKQQKLGNKKITDKFIECIVELVDKQLSYDSGPNLPSQYHINIDSLVGNCAFYKDEKRAAKGSFTQEYFTALSCINNLKFDDKVITQSQRDIIISEFLKSKELKVGKIRKILNLTGDVKITGKSGCNYDDRIFVKRYFSYDILKKLGFEQNPKKYWQMIDDIAYVNSRYKSDEKRLDEYEKYESISVLLDEQKQELLLHECSSFGNLSIKAQKKLIPFLEEGCVYSLACERAELVLPSAQKNFKLKYNELSEINDLTSPVVRRAVSQTIKVLNAIIDKYGSPSAIFIELAREMGKSFEDRKKIAAKNQLNQEKNDKIKNRLIELGILNPRPNDIVKLKLYDEQGGKCAYSGKSFVEVFGSMENIFKDNNTQIDHVIPFSKCFNDSYNNKVLVLASENQNKGNRTPYEYFGKDEVRWNSYQAFCLAHYGINKAKLSNMLVHSISDQQEAELNNRALNDTRYMAKFLKNLIENHLIFAQSKKFEKKPVKTVNGAMTSFLRKIWGIPKARFQDDKHHAVDATIIACTDAGMVQRVTLFLQTKHAIPCDDELQFIDKSTGEVFSTEQIVKYYGNNFQMPYENFKKELLLRIDENVSAHKQELKSIGYSEEDLNCLKSMFISRMVNHKVTGPMHDATIRSKKLMDQNADKLIVVTKTAIQNLVLDADNQIKDYPIKFRESDRVLYDALRNRLIQFKNAGFKDYAKEAFKEPFYKPTKSSKKGNLVKTVKLQKILNDGINVNNGLAENSSMIRLDIFEKNGKNYAIPVYVADYYKHRLPNKLSKSGSSYKTWPELDDTYKFKFSLCKNDVIKLKSKKGIDFVPCDKKAEKKSIKFNDIFVYYNSFDRSGCSIKVETIDGRYTQRGIGIQNLITFEKYEVDFLGNIKKVLLEKRKSLAITNKSNCR